MSLRSLLLSLAVLAIALPAAAAEKKLMHCFAYTEIADASEEDWDAFYKATDELPSKIEGLSNVWYGKLRRPLRTYGKNAEEPTIRQSGVCMELADEAALAAYASDPAHAEWVKVYEKVRKPGTTTFDIIGQ